jgi:hypothetical protein
VTEHRGIAGVDVDFCKYTCEDRRMPRPATGKTPVRNLRVPDHIWEPALAKAHAEGKTLTEVITAYLRRYIATPPRPEKPAAAEPESE